MSRRRLTLATCVVLLGAILGGWRYWWWREHRYDTQIQEASWRYGVDPALVKAVMWRESWFNADARGSKQELGLMQIRALAAQEWAQSERIASLSTAQLLDPATNTLVGAWYLSKLLRRYPRTQDPIPYALADYNAGRGNVLRWIKGPAETNAGAFLDQMDFPGTRRYVNEIAQRRQKYHSEKKQSE